MSFADELTLLSDNALSNALEQAADEIVDTFKTRCKMEAVKGCFSISDYVVHPPLFPSSSYVHYGPHGDILCTSMWLAENRVLFHRLLQERLTALGLESLSCKITWPEFVPHRSNAEQRTTVRISATWARTKPCTYLSVTDILNDVTLINRSPIHTHEVQIAQPIIQLRAPMRRALRTWSLAQRGESSAATSPCSSSCSSESEFAVVDEVGGEWAG